MFWLFIRLVEGLRTKPDAEKMIMGTLRTVRTTALESMKACSSCLVPGTWGLVSQSTPPTYI